MLNPYVNSNRQNRLSIRVKLDFSNNLDNILFINRKKNKWMTPLNLMSFIDLVSSNALEKEKELKKDLRCASKWLVLIINLLCNLLIFFLVIRRIKSNTRVEATLW